MAHEQLIDDVKNIHTDYMRLSGEQNPFLTTRLKTRIKLRFKNDLIDKITNKKKLEKTVSKNISRTRDVSWSRIKSLMCEEGQQDIMEAYRSWLFSISLDILLLNLIIKHKESGMNELYRLYNLPIKSYIAKNLFGKKGTEFFASRCHDLMMETFQRFERYAGNFNPYKGSLFSYLISVADHLIKDETTRPETLTPDFNEHDEDEAAPVFWAVSSDLSPDQLQEKNAKERFLLEQIILEGGYPWQILVVLLTKTTDDRTDITRLSDLSISNLFLEMKNAFSKSSFHEEDELNPIFKPLEKSLCLPLKEIIPSKDHRSRTVMEGQLDKTLGELPLKVFFGKDPLKTIRDWNHRVLKRVRKKVLES